MTLYDLLYFINDNCIVELWDENQNIIDTYDGKESISSKYDDYTVNDIFTGLTNENIPIICIEIETSIDNY